MFDNVFNYELNKMNQLKAKGMNSTGYTGRDFNLSLSQQIEFKAAIPDLRVNLESLVEFLITQYGSLATTTKYESSKFYIR